MTKSNHKFKVNLDVLARYAYLMKLYEIVKWWVGGDSNPGPLGYEPSALTS